jgi:hypothetical protein
MPRPEENGWGASEACRAGAPAVQFLAMKYLSRQEVPQPLPLVLATRNPGKRDELAVPLLSRGFGARLLPPDAPDVEETGSGFEENALLKARAAARHTGDHITV